MSILAERLSVPLRIVTYAVRGRTMYPPEVGLHAEDEVLDQWVVQTRAAQKAVLDELGLPSDTPLEIATGRGCSEALDGVEWQDGEVLVVGSSSVGPIARVFVGSRATKIIRHSPVPVIVVPAAVAEEAAEA